MAPHPRRRGRWLLLLALGLLIEPAEALAPDESALLRHAREQMTALDQYEGTIRSRHELLNRNLSRYFARYLVPEDTDEFRRVLGTMLRMNQVWARRLYRASVQVATSRDHDVIQGQDVQELVQNVLPHAANEWEEHVFFPGDSSREISVEEVDLRAFRDTGLVWEVLGHVVQTEILDHPEALPMTDEAARVFGEAVNAYALLTVRIAGRLARVEMAPSFSTRHLRDSSRVIEPRDGSERLPPLPSDPAPPGDPFLTDVSESAGFRYRHRTSDWLAEFRRYGVIAPTFSGGGVTAGDLDGDRWQDLIVCGGDGCHAFRNQGDGTFVEVTESIGIGYPGEARMAVLADFDNDGRRDLFVTYARDPNRLWRNVSENGELRFEDVTEASGLDRDGDISGPALAFDYDNDGLLDIYVGNFGNYLGGASAWVATDAKNAMANRLYHNQGGLRFVDVSATAGVEDTGWAQALSHFDHDNDGDQDLYIANDFGRNQLLINRADGTFEGGGSLTRSDDPHHGMNVAFADVNRDTYPDIFVTNIWFWASATRGVNETNTLLLSRSEESGVVYDESEASWLLDHDSGWSWAALFFDRENDGDQDLLVLNGFTPYYTFIQYRPHPNDPQRLYAINNGHDANLFFRNDGGAFRFDRSGAELPAENSRSLALVDYDRDGDLDVALTTFHSWARLYRNDAEAEGHWLSVSLEGDPERGSNRDAIGSVVIARGENDFYAWRMVNGGEGYLGMSSLPVELGLGSLERVDLEVRWPSGTVQRFEGIEVDREIELREGSDQLTVLRP